MSIDVVIPFDQARAIQQTNAQAREIMRDARIKELMPRAKDLVDYMEQIFGTRVDATVQYFKEFDSPFVEVQERYSVKFREARIVRYMHASDFVFPVAGHGNSHEAAVADLYFSITSQLGPRDTIRKYDPADPYQERHVAFGYDKWKDGFYVAGQGAKVIQLSMR